MKVFISAVRDTGIQCMFTCWHLDKIQSELVVFMLRADLANVAVYI